MAAQIKHLANIITCLRLAFAPLLLLAAPFSPAFWLCYVGGGLSDVLDGMVARALRQQSSAGAKLDSVADGVFAAAIAVFVIRNLILPPWIWGGLIGIATLRCLGYGIGFVRYRGFSALHTYANKATGALLFAFPLLYKLLGLAAASLLLLAVALVSTAEEIIITATAPELKRDRKGLLIK